MSRNDNYGGLSTAHYEYLMQRHGRTDLDPLPSIDGNDPYNWNPWKRNINLVLVSFQSMITVLNAAAILPAVLMLARDLEVSVTKVTYLIGVQILFLGISQLLWKPIAQRYGRRPIFLISALGGSLFNVGCTRMTTFGGQIAMRILVSVFLSLSLAMGGAVVTETFFSHERARKMGIWTLAFTCGPALGPFIAGFIVQHTGTWRWIYWALAIISFASFLANIFFAPETLYRRDLSETDNNIQKSSFRTQYASLSRIDPRPFTLWEFYLPYLMLRHACVLLPSVAYAVVFNIASPALSIAIPSAYSEKFHLNSQEIGLQFIAILIGSILGEVLGGRISDSIMNRRERVSHGQRVPEFRLWVSYLGFVCVIAGVLEWVITLEKAPEGPWTVIPDIGLAIAAFGNQLVSSSLITYSIDCFSPETAATVGSGINQIRQIWSFVGPFWFTPMYQNIGYEKAAGIMVGMVVGVALLPTISLQIFGGRWRKSDIVFNGPTAIDEPAEATLSTEAATMHEEKEITYQVERSTDTSELQ